MHGSDEDNAFGFARADHGVFLGVLFLLAAVVFLLLLWAFWTLYGLFCAIDDERQLQESFNQIFDAANSFALATQTLLGNIFSQSCLQYRMKTVNPFAGPALSAAEKSSLKILSRIKTKIEKNKQKLLRQTKVR